MQAAQSLDTVNTTLADFRTQLGWGLPLVLILAGAGGYFLANRALSPITRITTTAHEITAHDLSRRLDYPGPADEIGQLAHTFDEMLARLHDAFRNEQRFTSDAAHELRTPLTVLKGQIEVTLSRPRPPAEYETKLHELGVQVDRLIRLTNALLFLSRSDQKQLSWHPVPLNLTDMLEVIVEQFQPMVEKKNLSVQMILPPALPVVGDPDHLTRLFLNLLDNTVKYTPRGGQITIQAPRAPARITIHNTGPGIPPEHLPHLFERFYRVDADRSRETGGDGLGLAIAQEIVRLHGGEIRVESAPGQGVTVTVFLPNKKHS
jgi:heavy metal sensor kinase